MCAANSFIEPADETECNIAAKQRFGFNSSGAGSLSTSYYENNPTAYANWGMKGCRYWTGGRAIYESTFPGTLQGQTCTEFVPLSV